MTSNDRIPSAMTNYQIVLRNKYRSDKSPGKTVLFVLALPMGQRIPLITPSTASPGWI